MGKVIVAIKPSSSGGASGLTRYIAESKRNPEKEGLKDGERRPLFSATEDRLTYLEANELLAASTGALAEKEDLIHLVISPEKAEFEKLGQTREERVETFMNIIRETAAEIEKEVNFVELHWIAGIHLNTEIPHAHLAISREGLDRTTEKRNRLQHLPRTLLPHNDKNAQLEKEFVPGKIAQTVSNAIEREHQLLRQNDPKIHSQESPSNELTRRDQEEPLRQDAGRDAPALDSPAPVNLPTQSHEELPHENAQTQIGSRSTEEMDLFRDGAQSVTVDRSEPDRSPDPSNEELRESLILQEALLPDTYTSFSDEPQETDVLLHEPSSSPEDLKQPQANLSEHLWRDRYILGRAMVARANVDRLESDLKSISEHGDKRRFRVFDATRERTRRISEFDIRRRADASASTAVRQAEITDPDKRHQARQSRYDSEIDRHDKGIGDHQIIVSKIIVKLEGELEKAQSEYAQVKPHVARIQQKYKSNHTPLPVPLLAPEAITQLQDQAIAARNPTRVQTLENIRESLAAERGVPSRSDEEIARVEGQLLIARSEQAARQERADQFERTRHQTRWEIDGEKYSLADLDRRISEQENRSRFFGTPLKITTLHLRPSSRREAARQVIELNVIREAVVCKIDERRQELAAAVKQAGRLTSVLSEIHVKERDRQFAREATRHEKLLTRSEINQLIEHGNILADPAMLKQTFLLEDRFEERHLPDDEKPTLAAKTARAIGRDLLTEIAVRQAAERLQAFNERKQFLPVPIKDLEGREQTARLFDFRHARHPLIWLAERIVESKEHRHLRLETTKAVEKEQARLTDDLTRATQCHELTRSVADVHRQRLISTGEKLPDATFSPKQIIQLEIYATRQQDPAERFRVETLINRAEFAAQTHGAHTHHPAQPSTDDHVRCAERPYSGTPHDRTADTTRSEGFNRPEPTHPSQAHLAQRDQPKPDRNPQLDPTHPGKDAPDLDLLH